MECSGCETSLVLQGAAENKGWFAGAAMPVTRGTVARVLGGTSISPEDCDAGESEQGASSAKTLPVVESHHMKAVFQAVISSSAPEADDLDHLARAAACAAAVTRLRPSRGRIVRTVELENAGAEVVRWRIIEAAVALLTSENLTDVKSCPNCGWFFLDTSKNGSRRWCSMRTCGSLVKARRYYHRVRR
jgi:predicted RNA-binding Zn ribbon-like protein